MKSHFWSMRHIRTLLHRGVTTTPFIPASMCPRGSDRSMTRLLHHTLYIRTRFDNEVNSTKTVYTTHDRLPEDSDTGRAELAMEKGNGYRFDTSESKRK